MGKRYEFCYQHDRVPQTLELRHLHTQKPAVLYGQNNSVILFTGGSLCEQSGAIFQPTRDIPLLLPASLQTTKGKDISETFCSGVRMQVIKPVETVGVDDSWAC